MKLIVFLNTEKLNLQNRKEKRGMEKEWMNENNNQFKRFEGAIQFVQSEHKEKKKRYTRWIGRNELVNELWMK